MFDLQQAHQIASQSKCDVPHCQPLPVVLLHPIRPSGRHWDRRSTTKPDIHQYLHPFTSTSLIKFSPGRRSRRHHRWWLYWTRYSCCAVMVAIGHPTSGTQAPATAEDWFERWEGRPATITHWHRYQWGQDRCVYFPWVECWWRWGEHASTCRTNVRVHGWIRSKWSAPECLTVSRGVLFTSTATHDTASTICINASIPVCFVSSTRTTI